MSSDSTAAATSLPPSSTSTSDSITTNGTPTKTTKSASKVSTGAPTIVSATKIDISNLHPFVTEAELSREVLARTEVTPSQVKIIFYGPKATGRAWIELQKPEDALKAFNGLLANPTIRDQAIQVSMASKNKVERQVKKLKQRDRKPKKNSHHWDDEVVLVRQKFSSSPSATGEPSPTSFEMENEGEDGISDYSFIVSFPPSDPDFPFDLERVRLRVSLPSTYPATPCRFEVLNDDLRPSIRANIASSLESRAKAAYLGKPMILGLIRYLNANLEKLLIDKKTTFEHQMRQHGIEVVVPKFASGGPSIPSKREFDDSILTPKGCVPVVLKKKDENEDLFSNNNKEHKPVLLRRPVNNELESDRGDAKEQPHPQESVDEKDGKSKKETSFSSSTAHKGTQILVEGKTQDGIGIVRCKELRLLVTCERCRVFREYTIPASSGSSNNPDLSPWAVTCKCNVVQDVRFREEMMHETASVLGYLDVTGCRPFEVLASNYTCTCLECATDVAFDSYAFGTTATNSCPSCHHKLTLRFDGFRFYKIRPVPENLQIVKKPKKVKDPNMEGIVPGKPLPKNGACKHYKRSHRWLRFPCCGRAFPCDTCHDEHFAGEHEVKWATRMLCGYCSREQQYSYDKPCAHCKANLTGGSHSIYWEGGQGCRNKSFMSNKDSHKFKNSKLKTQSKKSQRVGQAGAAAAQASKK